MAADGVSQREIAARLGINRQTVKRLIEADEPPCYRRAPAGSMLDAFEAVIRRLMDEWPQIKAPRVTELLRDEYRLRGIGRSRAQADGGAAARGCASGAAHGLSAWAGGAGRLGGDADATEDRRSGAQGLRADLLAALLGRLDGPFQL